MIEVRSARDQMRLRRLALAAQGLLHAQPFGRGLAGARRAISHIGYVQIDTISVVERAHQHVLYNRVPGYEPAMLDRMLADRDIFEYWAHAAAFLPMTDLRFSLPYKHAIKSGQVHWYRNPDQKLMRELLARIRSDGPLRSRDLDAGQRKRSAGWWDWKPAKKALEQLYMQGDLMICKREGFQKTYDLTERVLPAGVDTRMPDSDEFAAHLLDQQLRAHGLVSLKGLTYLRRNAALRAAVRRLVDERLDRRELESIRLADGEAFFAEAGAMDRRVPRATNRVLVLSPFDNSVIQRDRVKALFHYDYQLECYVPEAKRKYGYFCLPLVYRDEFVGRMDCKAHRGEGRLEIKSLHIPDHEPRTADLVLALAASMNEFCRFQGCTRVSLNAIQSAALRGAVENALQTFL